MLSALVSATVDFDSGQTSGEQELWRRDSIVLVWTMENVGIGELSLVC